MVVHIMWCPQKHSSASAAAFASINIGDPYRQLQKRCVTSRSSQVLEDRLYKPGGVSERMCWKNVNPTRRPASSGAAFKPAGLASSRRPNSSSNVVQQWPPPPPRKKGDVTHEKRNIYTNPGKKGGYGVNLTTLSERKGAGGVVGEYKHIGPAPEEAAAKREEEDASKLPPFKSAVRPQHGVSGAISDYRWEPRPPPAEAAAPEVDNVVPFKPAKGSNGTFDHYPEHQATPPGRPAATGDADKPHLHARAWSHTASNHSGPNRSIVAMTM